MKKIFILTVLFILPLCMMAQQEEDTENGVVSLAGKEGFTIGTKKGDFLFKPYLLVQTSATVNYYDDEGLDKAYNQDNVANSGFAVPYKILIICLYAVSVNILSQLITRSKQGGFQNV